MTDLSYIYKNERLCSHSSLDGGRGQVVKPLKSKRQTCVLRRQKKAVSKYATY